nr:tetratricopeptide repeat protein [Alsobacter ponti]
MLSAGAACAPASAESYTDTIDAGDTLAGNFLSAVVAAAARDTSAAAFFYREALRDDPRNPELTDRAFVSLLVEGSYPDAARLAERIVARDQNNALAQLTLGVRDMQAKQFPKVRARLGRSVKNRPVDFTSTLIVAWSWLGSGNAKKALETVDSIKGEAGLAAFKDYHAGLIAELAGNQAEAGRRLKAAYEAEKRTLRIVDAYGRFLSRQGKPDEAKAVYREFEKILPRHPIVTSALEQLDQGKTLETLVPNAQAGAGEVLFGVGSASNRQGDELASMFYLRLSLWLAPNNGLAWITLADIYDRLKQMERANDTYDSVPEASPLRRGAQVQVALNLEQLDRKDEAVARLEGLVAKQPNDIEALTALGNVYRSRKDFAKAAEAYSRAVALVGDNPDASRWSLFYFRGIAYERSKDWPKAEADFKTALRLSPDQPLVLNYLGYTWVDKHMNLDEAFQMLKKAVDQRPTDGYIVDSLGWAYYRLGRYDEALRILERAIELKPSDPVINDHLGDAYWRSGRKLEAGFQWNHARDLKPEPEDLPRILEKIEKGLPDEAKPAAAEVSETKANGG